MPLYEYKCDSCGSVFEVRQKFSDEPVTVHEGCGGKVQRLISASTFQLKGSGWYATDYARKNGGNKAKDSAPKTEVKTETKTEAKTETKTESKPSAVESKK